MTKILLISDTHGCMDDTIMKYAQEADEVWHAGDIGNASVTDCLKAMKPLRAVYGNIDDAMMRKEFPLYQKFTIDGVQVLMTHIGGYPGRYDPTARAEIIKEQPKLFISGHSHILKVMYDKKHNLLHLNPGACGKYGMHQVRTMLRFQIEGTEIKKLEIIEKNR